LFLPLGLPLAALARRVVHKSPSPNPSPQRGGEKSLLYSPFPFREGGGGLGLRTRYHFKELALGAVALAIALVPAAAWIARNRLVGDFAGISSVTAVNLLKYKAAGVEAELRGTSREVERDRLTAECEALLPPGASMGQRYRLWQQRGVEILLAHPLVYAKLHAKG